MLFGVGLFAALVAGQAADSPEPLDLVCTGSASMVTLSSSTAFISTPAGASTATQYGLGRSEITTERIRVHVGPDGVRIKLPASMRPPNIFDRRDEWWPIDGKVDASKIEGRFSVNPINKPKMVIDRNTGDIDIRGGSFGTFSGSCERAAEAVTPKF